MELARASRRTTEHNCKQIQQQVTEKRLQLREEIVRKSRKKVEKQNEQKQKLAKEYLIQTVAELDEQVEQIETLSDSEHEAEKRIRNLIKTQSSIRTQLLNQKDAKITFSCHRRPKKTSIILTELRQVIEKYETTTLEATHTLNFLTNPNSLVKKHIKHKLKTDNGEEIWYDGIVVTYKKRSKELEIQYTGEDIHVYTG